MNKEETIYGIWDSKLEAWVTDADGCPLHSEYFNLMSARIGILGQRGNRCVQKIMPNGRPEILCGPAA